MSHIVLCVVLLALGVTAQVNQPMSVQPIGPQAQPQAPPRPVSPGRGPFMPPAVIPRQDTIADKIVKDPELSEIVGFLRRVDLLKSLNATSFVSTVFLPSNKAITTATIPTASMDLLRFVEYHYVAGNITSDKMLANGHKWTLNGTYFNGSSVWFNVKTTPTGVNQYWVNGAQIISPDNVAANGVYHVIDRVLQPIGSLKSISEYIKNTPDFITMSKLLKDTRAFNFDKQLSNETLVWTVFAPTDSAVPSVILDDKNPVEILSRHAVKGRVLFDSCLSKKTSVQAVKGDIRIVNEAGKVYVQNGEGERAEVVQFNQPTENGVIHRIADVLGYAWRTLLQTLEIRDTLTTLKNHVVKASLTTELDRRDVNYTLFAPTNQAFATFMRNKVFTNEELTRLVKCHIADQTVTSHDLGSGVNDVVVSNLASDEIRLSRTSPGGEITVSYHGHRSKVVVADIKTLNGVMHIVDRVFESSANGAGRLCSLSATFVVLILSIAI